MKREGVQNGASYPCGMVDRNGGESDEDLSFLSAIDETNGSDQRRTVYDRSTAVFATREAYTRWHEEGWRKKTDPVETQ
jgi:hypothetical protein